MAVKVALVVPVYKNFQGFAELMHSVDYPVLPLIVPNWQQNLGVSVGWNVGIYRAIKAGCEFALVCNDDITLDPGTIQKLIDGADDGNDLTTAVNTRDGSNLTDDPGYRNEPDFACFMIKPRVFTQKFGQFDQAFTPAYFEDNDMAYRIKIAGGRAVCRTDAGMFHKGSITQNWGGEQVVTGPMFESNRAYYAEKWGGWPGSETFTVPFGGKR